jgi:hypothetical protein
MAFRDMMYFLMEVRDVSWTAMSGREGPNTACVMHPVSKLSRLLCERYSVCTRAATFHLT